MKDCLCGSDKLEMKAAKGAFNDTYHWVECQECKTRTLGKWAEEDARKDWDDRKYFKPKDKG